MNVLRLQDHIVKVLESRNIFYITPVNVSAEKNRFFRHLNKGMRYNPRFKYRKILFNIKKVESEINSLIRYRGIYQHEINNIAKRYLLFLNLIINRGNSRFTEYSKLLYGCPSRHEVSHAKEILKNCKSYNIKSKRYTSEQVKQKFQKQITEYGWKIALKNISSKMTSSET